MSSRLPDGIQIHEEERMSESHSGDSKAATGFDDAATKKLVRKLDLRLMPILATIYLFFADKMKQRECFTLGCLALGITGSALLISSAFPTTPLLATWVGNNLSGSLKRVVDFGMVVGFGNFGGIVAAFIYRSADGPRSIEGHSIFLSLLSFAFVLTALMMTNYKMESNRRDARDAERGLTADTYISEMKLQQKDEGDNATFWRYTLLFKKRARP